MISANNIFMRNVLDNDDDIDISSNLLHRTSSGAFVIFFSWIDQISHKSIYVF